MRTLKSQNLHRNEDEVNFPEGTIVNQTEVVDGTPVVEEVYGDLLTNIYKIVLSAGLTFTNTQDSETTQYQIYDAFKRFVNDLNDKLQVLTINERDISVNFDYDHIENNYIFIGRNSENLVSNANYYTFKGNGDNEYPVLIDVPISSSSLVIVILNQAGTSIIPLQGGSSSDTNTLNFPFGVPLSYNEGFTQLYFDAGWLIDGFPKPIDSQKLIRDFEANLNIEVLQAIFHKGRLICFTLDPGNNKYQAFSFTEANFEAVEGEIDFLDDVVADNSPYIFCDGSFIYITNSTNTVNASANDYSIGKFTFDENTLDFNHVETILIDAGFQKTTNVFINLDNNKLYTFVNGAMTSFPLDGGVAAVEAQFNNANGLVFKFNKKTYYMKDEVAVEINY